MTAQSADRIFLFSVDLEEFYAANPKKHFYKTPLPELTERYLDLLRRHGMRATFFVVGEIARKFPSLIREIHEEGHELACHTDTHLPLDQQTPETLREDLKRNIDALQDAAETEVNGFRAPILSLTERTCWAYAVLAEAGFRYSSSVLPAFSPLYGWPGFGSEQRVMDGVTELPVTLARPVFLQMPIGSGTYFRCLPRWLVERKFRKLAEKERAITGYFHPYDVDARQGWAMHQGVQNNRFLNWLLFVNRSKTIERLERMLAAGFKIVRYRDYLFGHQRETAPGKG